MGNCWNSNSKSEKSFTRIHGPTAVELQNQSGLNLVQLRNNYDEFVKKYPKGTLTKDQFADIFNKFFSETKSDSDFEPEKVFTTFDQDNSGTIDFREFTVALSAFSQGSLMEKLSLAFYLYDENGDGVLSYEEILGIVKAMFYTSKQPSKLGEFSNPEELAESLFADLDFDKDGKITLNEFTNAACKDSTVANLLLANQSAEH